MSDALRSGLLLFAMLSALGAVPVLLRRLRPASLLLVHALGISAGLGVALAAALGRGDGRPLLGVYVIALALVGIGGRERGGSAAARRWFGRVGGGLAALALLAEGALLADAPWGPAAIAIGVAALGFGGLAAIGLWRRARQEDAPSRRAQDRTSAVALLLAMVGLAISLVPGALEGGLWPVLLAAAGALVTAVWLPPYQAPSAREKVTAVFLALAVFFALAAVSPAASALLGAAGAALLSLAISALSRPLLAGARVVLRAQPSMAPEALAGPAVAEGALGVMAPLLDDALLRRPARPHVVVRVGARRLLDAALERARQGQSSALRKAGRLSVEIHEDAGDVDVEGDPADLAEALCAVLDNALGLREAHPDVAVRVRVRGGPSHVTFEISDDLLLHLGAGEVPPDIDASRPFLSARAEAERRPGLGFSLARARLLVERQGGQLLTRRTPDGSCVQLTLPRRQTRSQVGVA